MTPVGFMTSLIIQGVKSADVRFAVWAIEQNLWPLELNPLTEQVFKPAKSPRKIMHFRTRHAFINALLRKGVNIHSVRTAVSRCGPVAVGLADFLGGLRQEFSSRAEEILQNKDMESLLE
jgi:hypothetical protein